MAEHFSAEIGPYSIRLPGDATLGVIADRVPCDTEQVASTRWVIGLNRYRISVTLDARSGLGGLKEFIDYQTKSDVTVDQLSVNGVPGVRQGDYGPVRTWIDWWFKRGDTMICLCLQSIDFPATEPTTDEVAEHRGIINSLKFIPDSALRRPVATNVR